MMVQGKASQPGFLTPPPGVWMGAGWWLGVSIWWSLGTVALSVHRRLTVA